MVEKATDSRVEKAARNNAIWCDTLCRAHGVPGEFRDTLWINRHPVPRFYPNLVTLTSEAIAAQLKSIQALVTADLSGNWGVKDSFCSLDLKPLGFQVAFEATWLWREPSSPLPRQSNSPLHWNIIQTESELLLWENAWSNDPTQPRVFLPSLLTDPEIVFIAGYHEKSLIAGAIANRTGGVIGLSNVFSPPDRALECWTGCVTAITERLPNMPLVGYERGPQLAITEKIGFQKLQGLRVWIHQS